MSSVVNNNFSNINVLEPKNLDKSNKQQPSNINNSKDFVSNTNDNDNLNTLIAHTLSSLTTADAAAQPDVIQNVYQQLAQLAQQTGGEKSQAFLSKLQDLDSGFQHDLAKATQHDNATQAAQEVKQAVDNLKTKSLGILYDYTAEDNSGSSDGSGSLDDINLAGDPLGSDSDLSSILSLIKNSKGNILIAAMLLMLFLAQEQQKVISVDGQLSLLNKQYSDDLDNALAALTGIGGVIPYTTPGGEVIKTPFELFQYAYGKGKDDPRFNDLRSQLNTALPFLSKIMDPSTGKSYIDELNAISWGAGDKESNDKAQALFTAMFTGFKNRVNDDRLHIDPSIPEFPFFPVGSDGQYVFDNNANSTINTMMSDYKDAITTGNNVSNKLYAQIQADTTTYQQNFQGAIKFIEAYSQLSSSIWAR